MNLSVLEDRAGLKSHLYLVSKIFRNSNIITLFYHKTIFSIGRNGVLGSLLFEIRMRTFLGFPEFS